MFDAETYPPTAPLAFQGHSLVRVEALSRNPTHSFGKSPCSQLTLVKGLGVDGDAHFGATDQHLGLHKPNPPENLRQIHLFRGELMDDLSARGFAVKPGAMGENVVTRGVNLIGLALSTRLIFPSGAVVVLTGIRTPCRLLDRLGKGLMTALRGDGAWGTQPIAGVMGTIAEGGTIAIGDEVTLEPPAGDWRPLPAL